MNVIDTKNQKNVPLSYCIGRLIRKIRIENDLTGSELAKRVYLSQQQISRYERGQTGFQVDVLLRLLLALDMDEYEIKNFFSSVIEQTSKKSVRKKNYSSN